MKSKPNKGIWFYQRGSTHWGRGRKDIFTTCTRMARKADATKLENKDTEMALKTGD